MVDENLVAQEATAAPSEAAAGSAAEAATDDAARGERNRFGEAARRVLLAGIGAVALAQDEIEEFVAKLVERGELAETEGRKLVKDVLERRKAQFKEESHKAEGYLDRRLEALVARMNLPTRAEVAALQQRIAELAQKIEELKQSA